jgi:hypothetical protein
LVLVNSVHGEIGFLAETLTPFSVMVTFIIIQAVIQATPIQFTGHAKTLPSSLTVFPLKRRVSGTIICQMP